MRKLLSFQGRTPTDDVTLTKQQLAEVRAMTKRSCFTSPRAILLFATIMLGPLAAFSLLLALYYQLLIDLTAENLVMRVMLPMFLNVIISSLLVWIGMLWAYRIVLEPRYRKAMRSIGYDLCDKCDYRLDGLELSAPCPECGAVRSEAHEAIH